MCGVAAETGSFRHLASSRRWRSGETGGNLRGEVSQSERASGGKELLRGFGYEGGSNVEFSWGAPGFGEAYKQALREPRVNFDLTGFGEVLPRREIAWRSIRT